MKGGHREKAAAIGERDAYAMCKRKKRLKSGRASKMAHRLSMRKYECPICGHWHLARRK